MHFKSHAAIRFYLLFYKPLPHFALLQLLIFFFISIINCFFVIFFISIIYILQKGIQFHSKNSNASLFLGVVQELWIPFTPKKPCIWFTASSVLSLNTTEQSNPDSALWVTSDQQKIQYTGNSLSGWLKIWIGPSAEGATLSWIFNWNVRNGKGKNQTSFWIFESLPNILFPVHVLWPFSFY